MVRVDRCASLRCRFEDTQVMLSGDRPTTVTPSIGAAWYHRRPVSQPQLTTVVVEFPLSDGNG
jgi:hypothetical protein